MRLGGNTKSRERGTIRVGDLATARDHDIEATQRDTPVIAEHQGIVFEALPALD